MTKTIRIFLCLLLLISPSAAFAFETDQFNLPTAPLADIGAEVTEYTRENIGQVMDKINAEIKTRQNCLDDAAAKNCEPANRNRERLNYLRSNAAVERGVFRRLGAGFPPFTASGSWMESHQFTAQPARYKTSRQESIYAVFPSNYFTISETVNLYGAQFGTDKIAHIFQQGYTYLRIYERASAKGLSKDAAVKKACDWGRSSERTYYGNLVSGVYSNADLAANFAGFKFYQNLTGEILIGGTIKPPIFVPENGAWKFNEAIDLSESLLKPFVTNHLNEALNSSIYTKFFGLRNSVRAHVKNRACAEWRNAYPASSKADFENNSTVLRTWFGEEYGFTANASFITIANTCFDG
ncbi:MAG: hypothetical protein M3T96_04355 [Acidobacteriota bacterium]|nr:hypothetical protein [Acidobacteriota bacterium]